jgi:hypothetical protein
VNRICELSGCSSQVRTAGLCNAHYLRLRRHGDPRAGGRMRINHNGLSHAHPVEHAAWDAMIYRCHDEMCADFPQYGGRGIKVCERWHGSFEAFFADMGPRPSPRHSLDRYPDNDGNYEPGNCRWATAKEQADNRRNTKRYDAGGRILTTTEIGAIAGIPSNTVFMRLERLGWSVNEVLRTPVGQRRAVR